MRCRSTSWHVCRPACAATQAQQPQLQQQQAQALYLARVAQLLVVVASAGLRRQQRLLLQRQLVA
jgi:hypothetical protein